LSDCVVMARVCRLFAYSMECKRIGGQSMGKWRAQTFLQYCCLSPQELCLCSYLSVSLLFHLTVSLVLAQFNAEACAVLTPLWVIILVTTIWIALILLARRVPVSSTDIVMTEPFTYLQNKKTKGVI
jgi:hypothetical protein